ncbi:hypothetical protein BGAL_0313g00140 [Botrytis galanthina]|uniref:Developmental regulator protein n=1 Tax=Botrytis galanthina TaxID=278940 RepID=A0A4S8QU71_9HELO|nr:hypothetical protein BGAL_0313g00140 [Botrytis galanthina]
MPTYLLHGFRWKRENIRIYVILNDIEDAAPEWLMAPLTSNALLNSFYKQFDFLPPSSPGPIDIAPVPSPPTECTTPKPQSPKTLTKKNKKSMISLKSPHKKKSSLTLRKGNSNGQNNASNSGSETLHSRSASGATNAISREQLHNGLEKPLRFNDWSAIKLVEQYDPEDLKTTSQPWAYVSDYMVEIGLGVNICEEVEKYKANAAEAEPAPPNCEELGMSPEEIKKRNEKAGWLDKLRQNLEAEEVCNWYVVVCGDEERWAPDIELSDEMESGDETEVDDSPVRLSRRKKFRDWLNKQISYQNGVPDGQGPSNGSPNHVAGTNIKE